MASKKSNTNTASKPKKTNTSKTKASKSKASAEKARQRAEAELHMQRNRLIKSIILFAVSAFIICLYILPGEMLWLALHNCYWGFFGFCGVFIPLITLYCAVQYAKDKPTYRFSLKMFLFVLLFLLFSITVYAFNVSNKELMGYGVELNSCFISGSQYNGSGLFGGLLGIVFVKLFGATGTIIISIILLVIVATISLDSLIINVFDTFKKPVHNVSNRINENKEIRREIRQQEEKIKNERRKQERDAYVKQQIEKHSNNSISKNNTTNKSKVQATPTDFCRVNASPFYEPHPTDNKASDNSNTTSSKKRKKSIKSSGSIGDDTLDTIFGNSVSSENYTPKPKNKEKQNKEPPISVPPNSDSFEYVTEEMPVFADDIEFVNIADNNKKSTTNIPAQNISSVNLPKPVYEKAPLKETPSAKKVEQINIDNNDIIEGQYIKPPVTLLEPQPEDDDRNISAELHQNGVMLVDTLKSFGVQTTIVNISRGPSVTRYELQPAAGVKISKITNLSDDIAMNLAATGVRIEAPIPGKSAVGIEVPNKNVSVVKMRNLIESPEFINAKSKLTVALGYDITGRITLADLGKMPHLLIAGSTGSGKSVCINSMLVSLLYKSTPDEVKLMLIDPKVVELGVYNGIPNLLVPVVTDPRKAAGALNWAVNEMLERYKTFAEYNVRDIHSYNRLVDKQNSEYEETEPHTDDSERSFEEDEMLAQAQAEVDVKNPADEPHKLKKMPHIVIVIDELADLMMAAPNEVEESICRLAQMARAAGMHLVIATQRPSVDVITGLIKANVPSRIAFAVKSQIDSRTILDSGGAEKLLGRGDMLFSPIGTTKPIRVQGCYVDDLEIENIIEFIKKSKVVEYDDNVIAEIEKNAISEPTKDSSDSSNANIDPMMEQAIKCVVEAGQASTSLLQRRLRLGYARAGRLIDEMEQMGIVGPHEGSKPRQVLMSYQQWLERNMMCSDDEN